MTIANTLLHYKNALLVQEDWKKEYDTFGENAGFVLTFISHIESMGFTLSLKDQQALSHQTIEELKAWSVQQLNAIRSAVKGAASYQPLYANFPQEYLGDNLNLNDYEANPFDTLALLGYTKNIRFNQRYFKKPTMLSLESEHLAHALLKAFLGASSAWSEDDFEAVKTLVTFTSFPANNITSGLSNRENMARMLATYGWSAIPDNAVVTDAMRVAAIYAGGDPSLATPVKFKLSRPQRRALMDFMEKATKGRSVDMLDSMLNRKNRWLRLGEALHVGEFQKTHPYVFGLFDMLRNQKHIPTFNTQVEQSIEQGKLDQAVNLLTKKPGQLARQLCQLARDPRTTQDHLVEQWGKVVSQVPTQLLTSVAGALVDESILNMVMPKGSVAKFKVYEKTNTPVPEELATKLGALIDAELTQRFSKMDALGKVYIDPILKNVPIPSAVRSGSRALKTLPRGTQLPLAPSQEIRLFTYWSEKGMPNTYGIDVDLSAVVYNENFNQVGETSFWSSYQGIRHSGDVRSAPEGAAEYIDINFSKLPKEAHFITMTINSYSGVPFSEMTECFAGWTHDISAVGKDHLKRDQVEQMVDVTMNSNMVLTVLLDVKNRTFTWLDLSAGNSRTASGANLQSLVQAFHQRSRYTMYDLLKRHVEARGELVEEIDPENPPVIFDINTVYDTTRVQDEFLATP